MGLFDFIQDRIDDVKDFIDDLMDDTDFNSEYADAMESYEKTVKQYESYANKLRYRYSMIKKCGEEVSELCLQIKNEENVLKEMLTNQSAMKLLEVTEKKYIEDYSTYLKPIKVVTSMPGCKPAENPRATEWDTSAPDEDDLIAFLIGGPLGVALIRSPKGYNADDVENVIEARKKVVSKIGNLKKRITTASKKQSDLKFRKQICEIILQKINWYKDNY